MSTYRCKNFVDGVYDGIIFESPVGAAERRLEQLVKMGGGYSKWIIEEIPDGELSQQRTSVARTPDNSSAEFAGLVAVLAGIIGAILTWLASTQIGRKVLLFLVILVGVLYAMNAWENRAYTEKAYYENGNIKSEQAFKFKKLNGISKFYSADGKLEKEQNYKNNELDGITTEYYINGKPKSEQNYESGKLNGVSTFYLENGTKEKEQTYKDDVKNGASKIYYPNGVLKSEAMILNNKLNGLSVLYDENGNVLRKENFVNGKSTNIIE